MGTGNLVNLPEERRDGEMAAASRSPHSAIRVHFHYLPPYSSSTHVFGSCTGIDLMRRLYRTSNKKRAPVLLRRHFRFISLHIFHRGRPAGLVRCETQAIFSLRVTPPSICVQTHEKEEAVLSCMLKTHRRATIKHHGAPKNMPKKEEATEASVNCYPSLSIFLKKNGSFACNSQERHGVRGVHGEFFPCPTNDRTGTVLAIRWQLGRNEEARRGHLVRAVGGKMGSQHMRERRI